jgi:type I restriction enzyme M protein
VTDKHLTKGELESYLWGAANLLRGSIDAGEYKNYIFPLLFLKRLSDVYDEEFEHALAESENDDTYASLPEQHRFQVPFGAHWSDIRQKHTEVGRAIHEAMRAIEVANPKLEGVFGDAQWTNSNRLSNTLLRNLIEHFSMHDLRVANVPEDELGSGYEFLIKKFADDAGHTAQEFYTNRTVVHLMTELLQVKPGESVYDPTCGTGGMLLSASRYLRSKGLEHRNLRLYGQERNVTTSSIARMNLFLHGIEDFEIARADTLEEPSFVENDRLRTFDVVLANPPYSISQWNREAWQSDRWGRNTFGTPPQGRADYAFFQHIIASMDKKTGRCAILFPHGVLFRKEEYSLRKAILEADLVDTVIGLGPNLFYNAPMESCIVICRSSKAKEDKQTVLFIDAINEVTKQRNFSYLNGSNLEKIADAFFSSSPIETLSRRVPLEEIESQNFDLTVHRYVERNVTTDRMTIEEAVSALLASSQELDQSLKALDSLLGNNP